MVHHWLSEEYARGGWTFPKAGEDKYAAALVNTFTEGGSVFLSGSACFGEGGAWIKDGIRGACLWVGPALKAVGG